MLYDLKVWLTGLILLLPIPVLALAWMRRSRFYAGHEVQERQKTLYLAALLAASLSAAAYLEFWSWRVCGLYGITPPLAVLLILERFLFVTRLLSAIAIVCFFLGRGPYRLLLILTTLWVTVQIWMHSRIIHWA
ncbi:MAG TPA: hypothetical protein VE377_15440 [Candidatus Dormibacteraeota bacterium]|nr:hypothetical protein [Candidatus Dormibacteraeota bacterium]